MLECEVLSGRALKTGGECG